MKPDEFSTLLENKHWVVGEKKKWSASSDSKGCISFFASADSENRSD
jgi:hypothetical protein